MTSGAPVNPDHFATLPTYVAPPCAIVQPDVPLRPPRRGHYTSSKRGAPPRGEAGRNENVRETFRENVFREKLCRDFFVGAVGSLVRQ